jgi:hypothetical protein
MLLCLLVYLSLTILTVEVTQTQNAQGGFLEDIHDDDFSEEGE